jgi:protein BUR2
MPAFRDQSRHDASPLFLNNPVLERIQSQWLFTPEELLRTPSLLEGMPVEQELANRQKGVNFITQVGIMLKLPQLTLATASVYLHRFFMRHAMVQNNKPGLHHYSVAATAIFLATKVEENYRKMRELVVACCRVAQKQPNLVVDEQSKEYWKWRDTILHNEDLLLEALCFDLQLEQPHRILLDLMRFYDIQENKQLRNASWAFVNDSLITTLCLQLSPRVIAGSALYMGVKVAGVALPDDERGRSWWEQLGIDLRDIQKGCNLLAEVYENPALPRQGQKDTYVRDDDLSMFDKTRLAVTPQPGRSPTTSAASGSQGTKHERDVGDDPNAGEWGSTAPPITDSQRPPSPKRPRHDSRDQSEDVPDRHSGQRPTLENGRAYGEPRAGVDDLQRRIDDIVNAAAPSSRGPHANLSRRPSNQPSYQGDPSRRRSSSSSNWHGPPSAHSSGHQDRNVPTNRPDSRDNTNYEHGAHPDYSRMASRVPPGSVLPNHRAPAQREAGPPNGSNDFDDAEKVDYGSEEGEL